MKRILTALLFATATLAQGGHSVAIEWNASPDPAATGYNVWRANGTCPAVASAGAFAKVNTAAISGTTYTDTTVTAGTYCYYVTATAAPPILESVPSNMVVAGVLLLPPGSVVTVRVQ